MSAHKTRDRMRAVILAAGAGTRMWPLTESRPKAMLPIANRPLLEHTVEAVRAAGIRDVTIVVGFAGDAIEAYFGDGSRHGVRIGYVAQETRRGTGHAFGLAAPAHGERVIGLNGDVIVDAPDIRRLMARTEAAAIAVKQVADPRPFGAVETSGGLVARIVEKPQSPMTGLVNAGIYSLGSRAFEAIAETGPSPRGEIEITAAIQRLIDGGEPVGYEMLEGEWMDVGRPWDLLTANGLALGTARGRILGEVEPLATLKGEVSVGAGTIVRNGAYIVGPVAIGDGCDIGPNCYIRPATSIGDRVHIGNAVEVKNSIVMDGTNIGHLSYVGDSVIGRRCNLGAGTKIANLRLDGRPVNVVAKGQTVESGRRKLGAIMGDGVHTGIGCLVNAGAIIGGGAQIGPGVLVRGEVGTGQRIMG